MKEKFARAAAHRKVAAIGLTVLFHVALLGAVVIGASETPTDYLPHWVQQKWKQTTDQEIADTPLP